MLLATPIKSGTTISIKLSTGEEIIGRYESETATELRVSNPASLVQSQKGIGMAPFMFSCLPDSITLNKGLVVAYAATHKEIADKYLEQTTGIQLS